MEFTVNDVTWWVTKHTDAESHKAFFMPVGGNGVLSFKCSLIGLWKRIQLLMLSDHFPGLLTLLLTHFSWISCQAWALVSSHIFLPTPSLSSHHGEWNPAFISHHTLSQDNLRCPLFLKTEKAHKFQHANRQDERPMFIFLPSKESTKSKQTQS